MRWFVTVVAGLSAMATTHAQEELQFCFSYDGSRYTLFAELLNPQAVVLATIADLGFTMSGSGFSNVEYNSAFDSDFFGDADLTVTPTTVDFRGGNTLPPLNNAGGPDSSNPLYIMSFEADSFQSLDFVGQVTGAYVGTPFPTILTYQTALGQPGDTPYSICIPAPASGSLLVIAGAAAIRRRR